jgi:hypothetical protein
VNFSTVESATTILSLILGLFSLLGGFLLWHRGSVEKRYAAQRDFGHIKADLKTVTTHLASNADEVEASFVELRLELKELKALALAQTQRFEAILTRLEVNTSGWGRRSQE